jgi:hypothetical protein
MNVFMANIVSDLKQNNGTNNASTFYRSMFMKTTEPPSSTHDDTHQGLLSRTVGNGDVVQSNNLGADCSVDEPMPAFDSTVIEVPFSAAGAEDEKYADGRVVMYSHLHMGNDSPELQGIISR